MEDKGELVIPVIAEKLIVDTVPVSTGGVRIVKRLEATEELIEQQLREQNVSVERVAVHRTVDGPQPVVQREDGVLIIPIVQEVVTVHREWVVTEELHVTRSERTVPYRGTVTLHHEVATIEDLPADRPPTTKDIPS